MKCDRLLNQIKNWYVQVQEETMAPARMVAFMEQHIGRCEVCLADSDVREEVAKIRDIVLPPSKVPKTRPEDQDETTVVYDEDEASGDEEDLEEVVTVEGAEDEDEEYMEDEEDLEEDEEDDFD